VIIHLLTEPTQKSYLTKIVELGNSEEKMLGMLPRGGCFIKVHGEERSRLVRIQMLDDEEWEAVRKLAEAPILTKTSTATAPPSSCPKCGYGVPSNFKFCTKCGSSLASPEATVPTKMDTAICPNCGHSVPSHFKFCIRCGSPLKPPEVRPVEPKVEREVKPEVEEVITKLALTSRQKMIVAVMSDGVYPFEEIRSKMAESQ